MLFASHHDEVELDWRLKRRATPGVKPDIRRGQTLGREMGRGEEGRAKGVPAGCTLDRLLAARRSLLIAHLSLLAACSWPACCLLKHYGGAEAEQARVLANCDGAHWPGAVLGRGPPMHYLGL
jgi:hypothetical protein